MTFAKRITLFLITNILVLVLISIVFQLVGFTGYLDANGVNLDLSGLLVFSVIIGFGGAFVSLLISKFMAKRMMGATVITQASNPTETWLLETTAHLAEKAGIGMPEVAIFNGTPNAFATGWNRNNALVAVSTGLLQQMNSDEAEAVLAHEIAHVANGDMVTLALIQGVVNTFVFFIARVVGHFVDRVILKNERGHGIGFWMATIIAQIVFGILAGMVVMWFSRLREYRADAGAADLTSREAMVGALRALQRGQPEALPDQMAAFGINGKGSVMALLRSHPTIEKRISALGG
jgi:heat shock protein HtpX